MIFDNHFFRRSNTKKTNYQITKAPLASQIIKLKTSVYLLCCLGLFLLITISESVMGQAPGNVSSGLQVWFKADSGVTGTSEVTAWADQSGNGYHAVLDSQGPELLSGGLNGNPVLDFDHLNEEAMKVIGGITGTSISDYWIYVVSAANTTTGQTPIINEESTSTRGLEIFLPYASLIQMFNGGGSHTLVSVVEEEEYFLWTTGSSNSTSTPSGTNWATYQNGKILGTQNQAFASAGINADLFIGRRFLVDNPNHADVSIAEMIIYTTPPTQSEQDKIHSYLAIKYGITIDDFDGGTAGDYHSSNGTTFWDASVNTTFHNDVAVIGRDDDSGLDQRASQSANSTSTLSMTTGGPLASDQSFLAWGHNNSSGTSTSVPIGYDTRLSKVWKTVVSGTAEVVSVTVDLNGTGLSTTDDETLYGLLLDDDGDFSNGGTSIHTLGGSRSGTEVTFTDVTFTNNQYFTFATRSSVPGGVSAGLELWVKADEGVTGTTSVSHWADQSGNSNHASTADSDPELTEDQINFNKAIVFDGDDALSGDWTFNASTLSVIMVGEINASAGSWGRLFSASKSGVNDINVSSFVIERNSSNDYISNYSGDPVVDPAITIDGSPHIYTVQTDIGSSLWQAASDGRSFTSVSRSGAFDIEGFSIGKRAYTTGSFFEGEIGEIVVFKSELSITDRTKIESYLAIKYGLTLDASGGGTQGDYVASDGTDIWDASVNATYHNDLAVIGRDDLSSLSQQKTRSINSASSLTIDKGEAFGSDLNFIATGHNNSTGISRSVPSGIGQRMNKLWKAAVLGSPGTVSITIDIAGTGLPENLGSSLYVLLVDSDADLSNATVHTTGVSRSGTEVTFTGVSLSNDNVFTVATKPIPGGVDNLEFWFKADAGVTGTTSVSSWADQSGNGNDANVATSDPELAIHPLNYNYNIVFDGDDALSGTWNYANSTLTVIVVGEMLSTTADWGRLFSATKPGGNDADLSSFVIERDLNNDNIANFSGNPVKDPENTIDGSPHIYTVQTNAGSSLWQAASDGRNFTTASRSGAFDIEGFSIGKRAFASNFLKGSIYEIIGYSQELSGDQRKKIESYLSIKYGIALDAGDGSQGDIQLSNGSLIWDASANSSYNNDVVSIGYDMMTGLSQKQSTAANDSLKIFVGTLAATNQANAGVITNDLSGIALGHDGEILQGDREVEAPAGIHKRFGRVWKIQNENFSDEYSLEFEWDVIGAFDINHMRLLVDDDGDFTDAAIYGAPDVIFSNGSIIVSGIGPDEIPMDESSYITLASVDNDTPLPITYRSFKAGATADYTVELNWQTATEINNDFFTIERSEDALDWSAMQNIDGAGSTTQVISYQAEDLEPIQGISYYRIKQTDFDGQYSHSEIKKVIIEHEHEKQVNIHPNPAEDLITIDGDIQDMNSLRLIGLIGQDLTRHCHATKIHDQRIEIDISDLPEGIYMLKTEYKTFRIIKF